MNGRWVAAGAVGVGVGALIFNLFRGGGAADDDPERLERRFRTALDRMLATARRRGEAFLDVNAAALHKLVGGYPGPQHHMPVCCAAMRHALGPADFAVREPRSGSGATLTLRYHLTDASPASESGDGPSA